MSINSIEGMWERGSLTNEEFIDRIINEKMHIGNGELNGELADKLASVLLMTEVP